MNIEELKRQKRIHGLSEEITNEELEQLKAGVPLQKIIGFINFDNLQINVNHKVLIPRYETEEVVMASIPYIKKESRVLDLCTGSGYIGLTIKQKTGATVVCSDIDQEAIDQTNENANLNNLDVEVIKSDLFENIKDKFDLIISNPPYIPLVNKLDDSVLKHEPHHALFAGKDGNDIYKRIISEAPKYINEGGLLILEISQDNSKYIRSQGFEILKDINGKDRIAVKKY